MVPTGLQSCVQNPIGILGFLYPGVSNVDSAVSNFGYREFFGYSILLAIPALIGSIVGAKIAVKFNEALFKRVLAGVMIVVLCLILFRPKTGSG